MPAHATDPSIDPTAYTNLDVLGTLRTLGPWWHLLRVGSEAGSTERRPPAGGPTFDELADEQVELLQTTLGRLRTAVAEPPVGANRIDAAAGAVQRAVAGRIASEDLRAPLDDLVVGSIELLRRAGRTLAAVGALGAPASGRVAGLYSSKGGVPKLPIPSAEIGPAGLAGDHQQTRRHHGRPWQALCLWSVEVVERLAAEGHPIAPGSAGENISVSGLDWVRVRPGTRLAIGADVVAEVSVFALPCAQNAKWFRNGEFMRMHHDREPGVSRIYASVLHGGRVAAGDPVSLLP